MKIRFSLMAGILATLVAGPVWAIDTSKPFLFASVQVYECIDGRGCEAVLPEEVNAPTFMRVDVGRKQIRVLKDAPPTRIRSVTRIENRLILQGAEDGNPRQPDGTGWTFSIEEDTGRFAAAVTILQGSVSIFGACTEI